MAAGRLTASLMQFQVSGTILSYSCLNALLPGLGDPYVYTCTQWRITSESHSSYELSTRSGCCSADIPQSCRRDLTQSCSLTSKEKNIAKLVSSASKC